MRYLVRPIVAVPDGTVVATTDPAAGGSVRTARRSVTCHRLVHALQVIDAFEDSKARYQSPSTTGRFSVLNPT